MSFYINEHTGRLLETADNPPAGYILVQYPTQTETLRTNNKLQREAILADREIRQLCKNNKPLIAPFAVRYEADGVTVAKLVDFSDWQDCYIWRSYERSFIVELAGCAP